LKLSKVILYDEPSIPEIDISGSAKFLENLLGVRTEVRSSILKGATESVIRDILSVEIADIFKPFERQSRTISPDAMFEDLNNRADPGEAQFTGYDHARLFDGFKMQNIISNLIPGEDLALDVLSIVFLDMLTCTYSHDDFRYHARSIICANPAIISTAGIVVAPARPRQYVLDSMRMSFQDLDAAYAGRYIKRRDSRLPLITIGYLLQAVFHAMGEGFCYDKTCLLFNAHWQEDLIRSHIQSGKLCERHNALLQKMYGSKTQAGSHLREIV